MVDIYWGGQDLSLYASLGTVTNRYQLSFTNPWIYDMPISFGFDLYKKGHRRESDVGYAYDEDTPKAQSVSAMM